MSTWGWFAVVLLFVTNLFSFLILENVIRKLESEARRKTRVVVIALQVACVLSMTFSLGMFWMYGGAWVEGLR